MHHIPLSMVAMATSMADNLAFHDSFLTSLLEKSEPKGGGGKNFNAEALVSFGD